jgi:hypothetical protein
MKTLIFISIIFSSIRSTAQYISPGGFGQISVFSNNNQEFDKAVGTIIFSSINLGMISINALDFKNHKESSNAGFGIITSVTQIAYATIYEENQSTLQVIDLSLGTSTAIFSAICLLKKDKKKSSKKFSISSYSSSSTLTGNVRGISLNYKF